jgi:hypothetical protein
MKQKKQTLLSLAVVALWAVTIGFLSQREGVPYSDGFAVAILLIYTLLFGIAMGVSLLVMRAARLAKEKLGWFYNLVGILNLCLGAVGIVTLSGSGVGIMWFLFPLSLFLGYLIMKDIFRQPQAVMQPDTEATKPGK